MNQMTRIAVPAEGSAARFTTADFLRMAECGAFQDARVELIEGELQRMHQPRVNHAMRQARLVVRLAAAVGEALVLGEVGLDLGDDTVLGCDAAVLRAPIDDNRLLIASDVALVIEVAESTLDRDLGLKRRKYAEAGVPTYWVVDGARSVVHVHAEPLDGDYVEIHTVRFGQPLAVPGTTKTIVLD